MVRNGPRSYDRTVLGSVTVAGHNGRFTLATYSYSGSPDEGEALKAAAELTAAELGQFTAAREVIVAVDLLRTFRSELAVAVRDLNGTATLREDDFSLHVELKKGLGTLEAHIDDLGARLETSIATDQSYLAQSVRELETLFAAFPAASR
jgi:hypothetical protein